MRKTLGYMLLLSSLILLLSACALSFRETVEKKLYRLNIDPEYFGSLAICERVRIFAFIGAEYFDKDHFVPIVPTWLEDSINAEEPGIVIGCIIEEGHRQLGLLVRMPEKREEISLAIHTLVLKGQDLTRAQNADLKDFILKTLCDNDIYLKKKAGTDCLFEFPWYTRFL